jgi:hypothetical protein
MTAHEKRRVVADTSSALGEETLDVENDISCLCCGVLVRRFGFPISRDVDPGRAGEGVLFLILGFRAVSRSELPISVVMAGTCLAAISASLNHGLLRSPSLI